MTDSQSTGFVGRVQGEKPEHDFAAVVSERYSDARPQIQKALALLNRALYDMRKRSETTIPETPQQAAARDAITTINEAFGVVFPESATESMSRVIPDINNEKTLAVLITARNNHASLVEQAENPQLLARQAIANILRDTCEAHGIKFDGSDLQFALQRIAPALLPMQSGHQPRGL